MILMIHTAVDERWLQVVFSYKGIFNCSLALVLGINLHVYNYYCWWLYTGAWSVPDSLFHGGGVYYNAKACA